MSSELAHRITLLKKNHTTADIVVGADVSRETFRKIERGQNVKLDTLMDIADYLNATDEQRTGLIIAWVKLEIGDHAKRIQLTPHTTALRDRADDAQQILSLAKQLDAFDQKQILLAMSRPEVRRSLPALNSLYDTLKSKKR